MDDVEGGQVFLRKCIGGIKQMVINIIDFEVYLHVSGYIISHTTFAAVKTSCK